MRTRFRRYAERVDGIGWCKVIADYAAGTLDRCSGPLRRSSVPLSGQGPEPGSQVGDSSMSATAGSSVWLCYRTPGICSHKQCRPNGVADDSPADVVSIRFGGCWLQLALSAGSSEPGSSEPGSVRRRCGVSCLSGSETRPRSRSRAR